MNILKVKKSITLLVGMIAITALGGIAQAETRFAVQDPTGTTDKMVVTDQGYLGVGTNTPIYPLQISLGGPSAASTLEFRNTGNTTYNSYDAPTVQMMRNNSATATGGNGSTIPQANDRLGNFTFGSYFGTAQKYSASIAAFAEGSSWSSTSYPAYLSFMTSSSTNQYPVERIRITSWGYVGVGNINPKQRLEVTGGVRLNTSEVKPSCTSTIRGTLWFAQGGSGVADTMEVCAKDAAGAYGWKALF